MDLSWVLGLKDEGGSLGFQCDDRFWIDEDVRRALDERKLGAKGYLHGRSLSQGRLWREKA